MGSPTSRANTGTASFESGKGNSLNITFPEVETVDLKCVIHFDLYTSDYNGEFGFDWMRKNWLKTPSECVEGLEDLKKIYTPFAMDINDGSGNPYGDYYVPWLTMFPKHKEKIGKDVKLIVNMPFDYLANDIDDTQEITFEPSDANLRVEPSSFVISDLYNAKLVTIHCDGDLAADAVIEAKSPNGVVGKLNVAKNAHHKDLTINIPVVKAYLTDNATADEAALDAEVAKTPNLQAIEDFLNKNSLNQALVQVKFQYKDGKPYDWAFSTRSLKVASEGKNPRNGEKDYDYSQFKGMITNEATMEVDSGKILNFFHHQFKLRGENVINQKNIILYMTPLTTPSAGGVSYASPLNNKHCIIFKNNLDHVASYAHEISHTLGLLHTFPEAKYADQEKFINDLKKTKISYEKNKRDNAAAIVAHPSYGRYINKLIKNQGAIIDGYKALFKSDKYKFTKKKTSNIMDYDLSDQKFYFKYQIDIMQDEVTKYYH
ncbi:MAG: hypothetical protein AB8B56_07430 [Crocinitomicaceae bacterium]